MNASINRNLQNIDIPISNSIILNNYSIQNLIISPSINDSYGKYQNYENSYFSQKKPQNYFSPTPCKSNFKLNYKYNLTPITPQKFYDQIDFTNLSNSGPKKTKYIQIYPKIPKIIPISEEKHPKDSNKKKLIKNHIVGIKRINIDNLLKNSNSQIHLKTFKIPIDSIQNLSMDKIHKKNNLQSNPKNNISKNKKLSRIKTCNSVQKVKLYILPKKDIILNLKEFEFREQIGKGTFGNIFSVKWKKDNKYYAMKKETLYDFEDIKNRKKICKIIQNFVKNTGSKGVINLLGNLCIKKQVDNKMMSMNKNKINFPLNYMYLYYELMEKAERDWNTEITSRNKVGIYYTEKEIINIMNQLISTLSLLEKNHITHRDIKPQNILIFKGIYKLGDFGEIRVLERDGLIVQRVRGSELYMSPILFYGLHNHLIQVRHNTYKSDVFSLGMCLFYALSLTYRGVDSIREITDMKIIKDILFKFLGKRYSSNLILFILSMLEVDEKKRDNFIQLEKRFRNIYSK